MKALLPAIMSLTLAAPAFAHQSGTAHDHATSPIVWVVLGVTALFALSLVIGSRSRDD